uniref:DNA topoisomerase (ATP-hydrolyzing) n=1 Tax=viral metagenome TaxID=1070528 RepID=A0A6C0LTG7_9ZZZZ
MVRESKSIEDTYQKKTPHEHILDAPDTYIGSIDDKKCKMWIYNDDVVDIGSEIILKEIVYVPGFYKICDEIFVNARDHSVRCNTCTTIKINIDQKIGQIVVWNDGTGIDVVIHKKEKIMVPSMIFGELLTSTNYDKKEKKIVGGKNGYGAKLANIYSTLFEVETLDAKRGLKFYQKFTDNMYTKSQPKIKEVKGKKPYTQISFIPDFKKFRVDGITNDMMSLLKKRVYDIAMTTTSKVYFNDEEIIKNNFKKYVDLYFPKELVNEKMKAFDIKSNDRWKVCVVYDETDQLEHQNISFVNGICTSRGGTHVDYIINQVTAKLREYISKKVKGLQVKPSMIRENLIFFIDSIIENPGFDTQTKEYLTTKVSDYGSKYEVTDLLIKDIIKTGVADQIISNANAKIEASMGKGGSKYRNYKLYGAHQANVKNGWKCTLILTEGDSARSSAMSGLNVIGRDYYGIFPLKGKLLNVREENPSTIRENAEIQAIQNIIGLEYKKKYETLEGLKYGKILLLADQDVDGSHIKGLVMNFIHFYWPELAKQEGFIQCLNTPILKAMKGAGKKQIIKVFYNIPSFEEWKEKNNDAKGWKIKYYKGLGTSKQEEAQEWFEDIDDKIISYIWPPCTKEKVDKLINNSTDITPNDHNKIYKDSCEDAINLAFDKKRSNDRKIWINTYNPSKYLDVSEKKVSYYDFIHKELISFTIYANVRAIPNIMDGFKPVQRKVYCGSIYENIYNHEIKVAQLSGSISKNMVYHHGEQSLNGTIVGMAQNFVGSNNLNLLLPNGQFGTRLSGGQDSASERYIYTQLDEIGKKIFIEEDYDILIHQEEENKKIEPIFYVPIIPMVLVNKVEGIGMGYSTNIEPCDPRKIVMNLKRINAGKKVKSMIPWYRHFTGTIEKVKHNGYVSIANYNIIDNDTIHIIDLPIGCWTENYKMFLDKLLESGTISKLEEKKKGKIDKQKKNISGSKKMKSNKLDKRRKQMATKSVTAKVAKNNNIGKYIKSYTEDCTEIRINFTITFRPGKLDELIKSGELEPKLKLVTKLNITNMHLFDKDGKIKKYNSYDEILQEFAKIRLQYYQLRKDYLLRKWKKEMDILMWKIKFIENVIDGTIILFTSGKNGKKGTAKKMSEIIERIEELKFPKFNTEFETKIEVEKESYKYITTIGWSSLTEEELEKLKKHLKDKKNDILILEEKTVTQMWDEELDVFIEEYDKWEKEVDEKYFDLISKKKGSTLKKLKRKSKNDE